MLNDNTLIPFDYLPVPYSLKFTKNCNIGPAGARSVSIVPT